MKKGFTLIELLVVIAIIGILSSIVLVNITGVRQEARKTKAKAELKEIAKAIHILGIDTGENPRHTTIKCQYQNPECYVDQCSCGLVCTDGNFPNWQGPYITKAPKDPWGTYYRFDADWTCYDYVEGCEGKNGGVRALVSFGPNKSGAYSDPDNIVYVLCDY